MIERLKRLLAERFRLAAQLYVGLGGGVALTLFASLVGLWSFNQVDNSQSRVSEVSVPEMVAAFSVAQQSGTLVDVAPRLAAAATPEEFDRAMEGVAGERERFAQQLASLTELAGEEEHIGRIRERGTALTENIDAVEDSVAMRFALAEQTEALRLELVELQSRLEDLLLPAIDDQLFYTATGYWDLGKAPAPQAEHFSAAEINRYRHLAQLLSDANIESQLLASTFSLSDAPQIEPLRERFESTASGIERSLLALAGSALHRELAPAFDRLLELGQGEQGGFDLRTREIQLTEHQRELLARNRDLAIELVAAAEGVVNAANTSTQEATHALSQTTATGRNLLLGLNLFVIVSAVLIAWLFIGRFLLRRLERLSDRMRRMADGDLEAEVDIHGHDEVADMAAALEVFRRHALEVQRLNLVEKLAEELQGKNVELEKVLEDLRQAQDQIVKREKLAALGEVTAGVAHEIQNPLNFVKNFSEVSKELVEELNEILDEVSGELNDEQRDLVQEIRGDLSGNLDLIRKHGERANRIVHDMLSMGRGGGEPRATDINLLLQEYARLAYHSARATDSNFQLTIEEDLDPEAGELEVIPQDLSRVFLNLASNACYATDERRAGSDSGYVPTLSLITRRGEDGVEIRVRDNGGGIPPEIVEKIFQPFFTTKPTGTGTGLGLALSHDIVRQHGGSLRVETEAGEFTEMIIALPAASPGFEAAKVTEAEQ